MGGVESLSALCRQVSAGQRTGSSGVVLAQRQAGCSAFRMHEPHSTWLLQAISAPYSIAMDGSSMTDSGNNMGPSLLFTVYSGWVISFPQ